MLLARWFGYCKGSQLFLEKSCSFNKGLDVPQVRHLRVGSFLILFLWLSQILGIFLIVALVIYLMAMTPCRMSDDPLESLGHIWWKSTPPTLALRVSRYEICSIPMPSAEELRFRVLWDFSQVHRRIFPSGVSYYIMFINKGELSAYICIGIYRLQLVYYFCNCTEISRLKNCI